MFGPRFCNENLNVSFRVGGVTKPVPTNRAVALTYSLHFFHRLQELFSSLGIDFIFYRCDCRAPLPRLCHTAAKKRRNLGYAKGEKMKQTFLKLSSVLAL